MTGDAALTQVADWDVPLLRGAVGTLVLVAERLAPWRFRLDAVGRKLGSAACWSGPAGSAAAAALVELSSVATGVGAALHVTAGRLGTAVGNAAEAQHLAAVALSVAAAGGVALEGGGQPRGRVAGSATPTASAVGALAEDALSAADLALLAVRTAGEPLSRLRRIPVPGAVRFGDLGARMAPVGPVVPPPVPAAAVPGAVAAWWSGLSVAQQRAVVATRPGAVGGLDGLPGWARDLANRRLLGQALANLAAGSREHAMAEAVAAELARRSAGDRPVQLLQFDPAGDLVSLSLGDVDSAEAVAVLVPGILNTPADDLSNLVDDARDVAAAAVAAAPGLSVATVVWLGYRTPGSWASAPSSQLAQRGGPALDRALDGLAAARSVRGAPPVPRTTVLAHSYGTLVASRAAQAPGRLAADALVLLGSPGTEALTAGALEAAEVYGAWTPADPVAVSGWFGPGPTDAWFGDIELPTDLTQGHTEYYDTDRPTLAAIGEVVVGRREPG